MISLVMADDEERICRLMLALGEWDDLGIKVTGTASNGLEALELVKRENVDILITDIRMPGLGGMDLIREVNQVSPQTKIIIISGYSNFEYAQTAIEYGVKGYLLKPINRAELNDTLRKITEDIRKEKRRTSEVQIIREENEEAVRRARSTLIAALEANPSMQITAQQLNDYYYFRFAGGSLIVLVMELDAPADSFDSQILRVFWERAERILASQLEPCTQDLVMSWEGSRCTCILACEDGGEKEAVSRAREGLRRIAAAQGMVGAGIVSMGAGQPAREPEKLAASLEGALKAVKERLIRGNGKFYTEDVSGHTFSGASLLDQFMRDSAFALELQDKDGLSGAVAKLREGAGKNAGIRGWEVLELVQQAGIMLLMRLEVSSQSAKRDDFLKKTGYCASEQALFGELERFAMLLMDEVSRGREDQANQPVRLAKQYIRSNFDKPLTLELVAEHVGLTEAYFSVLFKKENGEGFAKYLSSVRFEEARRLLRETPLSVAEICQKVGYNDVKHFSRLFEKNFGVTPASYRRLYG